MDIFCYMKVLNRKEIIRFRYVDGLIRGYRNLPDKPAVSEAQYQSMDSVAQSLTVGNVAKVYEVG